MVIHQCICKLQRGHEMIRTDKVHSYNPLCTRVINKLNTELSTECKSYFFMFFLCMFHIFELCRWKILLHTFHHQVQIQSCWPPCRRLGWRPDNWCCNRCCNNRLTGSRGPFIHHSYWFWRRNRITDTIPCNSRDCRRHVYCEMSKYCHCHWNGSFFTSHGIRTI